MECVNAYLIQEKIRNQRYVTVPWIQKEYGLGYKEAVEFLRLLKNRGWVAPLPVGVQFPVVKGNLCLRKLARNEVDGLIEDITVDCVTALECIQKKEGGASYQDVHSAVRGDDDTDDALKILKEHQLIHRINELYFTTVSRKTVEILAAVVQGKRRSIAARRATGKAEDIGALRRLFDPLFV